MPRKLDESQDRGDFFKSLGMLFGGFVAERVEEVVTKVSPKLLRPPGALEEFAFLTACTRCDKCIEACPQDALLKAGPSAGLALNTPYLEPRAMPCFLCTELPCVTACPEGALRWPRLTLPDGTELEGPRAVRMGLAEVDPERCLTYGGRTRPGEACAVCVDRCPYPGVAIRAVADEAGVLHPQVLEEACTGCGLCVFGCPTPQPAIRVAVRR